MLLVIKWGEQMGFGKFYANVKGSDFLFLEEEEVKTTQT